MQAKVTLIFPPGTDPRSPHLALPSLAAALRSAGVDVELRDLDIEGLMALTKPDQLDRAGRRLRNGTGAFSKSNTDEICRLARLSEVLSESAQLAIDTLHSPERFYDPNALQSARETLLNCLDLLSLASPGGVRYNILPIRYDVQDVDPQCLPDLVRVSQDNQANLFAEFWETTVFPGLALRSPDLVGITITNRQQVIPGLMLARRLKNDGHFVVLGGTVYSKFAAQLAQSKLFFEYFADAVVVYEGETALLGLIEQLRGSRDFSKVPNLLFPTPDGVRCTRTHVEDVSALSTPDFNGLPLDKYLTPHPVLPILLGKGCYFNRCKFCDIPYINHVAGKAYRVRPTELVVRDILQLHERFECNHFEFTDETLAPALLDKLADQLRPYVDRDFSFVGYARLERGFTPALCKKLALMGLKKLFFGLESGAQETLDHMDKGIRVCDAPIVLRNCRDAGIRFHIFSIIGFPEESEESARKTCEFFQQNVSVIEDPGNSFDIHPFGLELRTPYAESADAYGLQIAPEALAKQFVIGVGEEDWTNGKGLSHEQVDRLLKEFRSILRKVYHNYHFGYDQLWPAFEEFAVLYADWYSTREFRHRASLSDDADSRKYRLRWNPSALMYFTDDTRIAVSSRYGNVEMGLSTYALLCNPVFRRAPDIISDLCNGSEDDHEITIEVRQTVDRLIQEGLLQIEPLYESTGAEAI